MIGRECRVTKNTKIKGLTPDSRESFEDERVAAILNEHFVSVKVDREERPDLDRIYMSAVQALTGRGGWPMSVFLTPDGRPFYGGTYFPPTPRPPLPICCRRWPTPGKTGARNSLKAAGNW